MPDSTDNTIAPLRPINVVYSAVGSWLRNAVRSVGLDVTSANTVPKIPR